MYTCHWEPCCTNILENETLILVILKWICLNCYSLTTLSSYRWLLKLYITPSQLVYVTGAALLGTCGFIAGIVGILHWREKVIALEFYFMYQLWVR